MVGGRWKANSHALVKFHTAQDATVFRTKRKDSSGILILEYRDSNVEVVPTNKGPRRRLNKVSNSPQILRVRGTVLWKVRLINPVTAKEDEHWYRKMLWFHHNAKLLSDQRIYNIIIMYPSLSQMRPRRSTTFHKQLSNSVSLLCCRAKGFTKDRSYFGATPPFVRSRRVK
jgi:hypothetical protein